MSGSIASKNVYELLGNDPEQDSDREPEPPTKAIEKTLPRSGKRSGPEPTKEPRTTGASARKEVGGNEGAFRDRNAGRDSNRSRPADDGLRYDRHPRHEEGGRGRGRGRGGRGPRGAPRDDRHSKTGISDHPKQAEKGWGGDDGNKELADEIAGETIAKEEESADIEAEANGAAEKAEDKVKSYDEYLADLVEKKAALNAGVAIRKPNEGAGKKFPEGKAVERVEEEYFAGESKEKNRERRNKEKNQVELGDIYGRGEERSGFRGGRGGRGGRGRGEGSFRGEGRGRGGQRGGPRGGPRGGAVNINDSSAFPSLGA